MDRWQDKNYLKIEGRFVTPGKYLTPYLNKGPKYAREIGKLNEVSEHPDLTTETIHATLT